jgi:hypothetical protein
MSDSFAKETAIAVPQDPEAEPESATSPAYDLDEKHKETSSGSLHSKSSGRSHRLEPPAATGNTTELPSEAQSTLVDNTNPSPPHGHETAQHDEKRTHTIEQNGLSKADEVPTVKDGEVADSTAENAEEDEIVYPGGLQLGLLTFGLCMATFTVALDNTIVS